MSPPPPLKALLDSSVQKAIEEWRLIGSKDIENADICLTKAIQGLKELCRKFRIEARDSKSSQVRDFIQQRCRKIERKIQKTIKQFCKSQEKRRKALDYCTIAFIGRSKAGKSTLFSTMTNSGFEGIGVGRQNTTRENREYRLGNIRLIDTPGVETPNGEELVKIAESIIDETDLICFVMTDNNQQESEFRFLEILRKQAKPFLILLNVKENLHSSARRKRFLENPNKSFSIEDKKALGGHIDRIRRYAEHFYGTSDFPIIPVQLLSAQMALQCPDDGESSALMKASRFSDFIDAIKNTLLSQGLLRRSQNILSGTVAHIDKFCKSLEENVDNIQALFTEINKPLEVTIEDAERYKETALNFLDGRLSDIFRKYRQKVPDFAAYYYNDSQWYIQYKWKEISDSYQKEAQDAYKEAGEKFSEALKERLEILKEEFTVSCSRLTGQDTESVKWLEAPLKSLLVTIAFFINPIVGLVTVVATSLFRWFESKETKRKRAISNLEGQLYETCNDFKKQVSSKKTVLDKSFQEEINKLKDLLNDQKKSFSFFDHLFRDGVRLLSTQSSFLNKCFAARILDFASGNPSESSCQEWQKHISDVRCDDKSINIITTSETSCLCSSNLESILQKKVSFKTYLLPIKIREFLNNE